MMIIVLPEGGLTEEQFDAMVDLFTGEGADVMTPAFDICFEDKESLEYWAGHLNESPYTLPEIERELEKIRKQEDALDFLV